MTNETRAPRDTDADETRIQETPFVPAQPSHLELKEERIVPRVSTREAGGVRINRRVVEEQEQVEVTLRHDELELERRPADRALAPDEQPVTERGDTTVVLVVEERLVVQKVPWVVEEIHLRRGLVSEKKTIADTVRKERIDIETKGDVALDKRQ